MLYSHSLGKGPNLIILHGLFGSGDNWRSVAKSLSEHYRVHCLDLPNHGQSPWTDTLDYPTFASAVRDWMAANDIKKAHLIGHSMGGKTAMQLALAGDTDWLQKLVIVDIAPRDYPPHHQDIFAALDAVDLSEYSDRRGVENALMENGVRDLGIRQFLLKSLYRDDNKQLAWRFNLPLLKSDYNGIAKAPDFQQSYSGPTLRRATTSSASGLSQWSADRPARCQRSTPEQRHRSPQRSPQRPVAAQQSCLNPANAERCGTCATNRRLHPSYPASRNW